MAAPARLHGDIRYVYDTPLDPQPSPQTSLRGHVAMVAAVQRAGLAPPAEWTAIHERYLLLQDTVVNSSSVLTQRLVDAVVTGPPGDIPTRLAAASVRIDPDAVQACHAAVHGGLKSAYSPVAWRHYAALAHRFDSAARRLAKLAGIVDPEASADDIVRDRRKLDAWEAAPQVAAELSELVDPLEASAVLARRDDQPWRLGTDPATFEIPLTLDVASCHARSVWLAFHEQVETRPVTTDTLMLSHLTNPPIRAAEHRCGRWGALLGVGAAVAAHPDPQALELFPPPRNRVMVSTGADGRRTAPRVVDPEDYPETRPGVLKRWFGRRAEPEIDLLDTVAAGQEESE